MGWSITVDKFLFFTDLKYGAWSYGGVMTAIVFYSIFINVLGWGGWIFYMFGALPMMVSFIMQMVNNSESNLWLYVWINWYITFFVFCLGTLQTIIQTGILSVMIANSGDRDYPAPTETIEVVPEEAIVFMANDQLNKALPQRFQEVIAFFHDGNDDGTYEPATIYGERGRAQLGWIMFAIWLAYLCMCYFTLVNYSYWKEIKAASTTEIAADGRNFA